MSAESNRNAVPTQQAAAGDKPEWEKVDFRTPAGCSIKVDNKELAATISSLRLEQFIDNHHLLNVRIREVGTQDSQRDIGDPGTYTAFLGCSIAVKIKPEGEVLKEAEPLEFIGVVTRVSLESQIDGLNTVLIVAHSPTIALDGALNNAIYTESKASDIMSSVLRAHPLTLGKIEATSEKIEYSVQFRETDYHYVMRLAGSSGLFAFYTGKEFKAVKASGSDSDELAWRETLGAFGFGLGTGMQNFKGAVWNHDKKQTLTGEAQRNSLSGAPSGLSKTSLDASEKIYGSDIKSYSAAPQTPVQASIDKTVARETETSVGRMIQCNGKSVVPTVGVGRCVKIKGMDKLDGLYWVKTVTHHFDQSGQYHNVFQCCPLDVAYPGMTFRRSPITYLHCAVVTDNNDPEDLGRVKVRVPWGGDDNTTWARVLTPDAGGDHGFYRVPDVDDEVLLGYEHGSPDAPLVLGCLYNGTDRPLQTVADSIKDGNNFLKQFKTKAGNEIQFDDTDGKEQICISQKDGKTSLTLTLEPGSPTVIIKSEANITIDGGENIAVECGGDLTMKAGGAMKLQTDSGDIEIKSGGALKGQSTADLEMKAGANFKAQSGANLDVQGGAMVNIKGGGPIKIQGPLINLN